jgi:hypothetical protein
VDATVLLLSIPMLGRSSAGEAFTVIERWTGPGGRQAKVLRFGAGSIPDRARGLNRYGYMEEAVVYEGQEPKQAAWFGVITTTTEESLASAKMAVQQGSVDTRYTTTQGIAQPHQSKGERLGVRLSGKHCWTEWDNVRSQILSNWTANPQKRERIDGSHSSGKAQLFLSSISAALEGQPGTSFFWHNSEPYRLISQNKENSLCGRIESLQGNNRSDFRLLMQPGNPLPAKIEYQAKSFLRLTLVAV